MAAASDFGSLGWLLQPSKFMNFFTNGIMEKEELEGIITADYLDNIFSGLKQFFYWDKKLHDKAYDKLVTITFLDSTGLRKPDVHLVYNELYRILGEGKVMGINYHQNQNFISFLLNSPESVKAVRDEVKVVAGALVCFVGDRVANLHKVRLLWSPPYCNIDTLITALKPWCSQVELTFETDNFGTGESVENNRVSGTVVINEGLNIETLPYVLKLSDGKNSHVLLIIKDRPPMCLRCRMVGHLRRQCDQVKCIKCHSLHSRLASCPNGAYAAAVNRITGPQSTLPPSRNDQRKLKEVITSGGSVFSSPGWGERMDFIDNCNTIGLNTNGDPLSKDDLHDQKCADESSGNDFTLVTKRVTRSMSRSSRWNKNNSSQRDHSAQIVGNIHYNLLVDEMDTLEGASEDSITDTISTSNTLKRGRDDDMMHEWKKWAVRIPSSKEKEIKSSTATDLKADLADHNVNTVDPILASKVSITAPIVLTTPVTDDMAISSSVADQSLEAGILRSENDKKEANIVAVENFMNELDMEQSEQKANEHTLQSVSNCGSRCNIFEPWRPVVEWPIWVTCKYCQRRDPVVSQPYQDFRCTCGKHYTPDIKYNIIYMR